MLPVFLENHVACAENPFGGLKDIYGVQRTVDERQCWTIHGIKGKAFELLLEKCLLALQRCSTHGRLRQLGAGSRELVL